MRAYHIKIVSGEGEEGKTIQAFAGSNAEAIKARRAMMTANDVKLHDVDIEEIEIPTSKPELLAFINSLV